MNHTQPEKDQFLLRRRGLTPWWLDFGFDNAVRRFLQHPYKILKPYVKEGWTVLDIGPGPGYFTIPLARLVGNTGKTIAADVQPYMLETIRLKALKAGLQDRITLVNNSPDNIGIVIPVDFCLAFWMVHETKDRQKFMGEIASCLKTGGLFLIVEPRIHVTGENFQATLGIAKDLGLTIAGKPKIFFSYTVLLKK
jgi:ubiquinone/menaquinone biosynthesis C-methylase UbiE